MSQLFFKKLIISFSLFLSLAHISATPSAAPTKLHNYEPLDTLKAISLPIKKVTDSFTKNLFAAIDKTFNTPGASLDPTSLESLKKAYLYLIFLTKLEKISTTPALIQYKNDFAPFLKDNNTTTPHFPTETLITSAGWQAVVITSADIINSQAWQLFCKSMICDTYVYFSIALQMIHNVEKQTFNYIPHFETSFYNEDYTSLRTVNEITRIKLILEENCKQRYLKNCPTWSALQKEKSIELAQAVVTFRQSPFYKITHDVRKMLAVKKQTELTDSTLTAPKLSSPLKEQAWCYFMLYETYGQLTSFITIENIDTVLEAWTNASIIPNIFPYAQSDYPLLDDILAAKSKVEGTHTSSIHPSPPNFKIEDIRPAEQLTYQGRSYRQHLKKILRSSKTSPSVKAQWFWSGWGHDITQAFDKVKQGVDEAWKATVHLAKAVGEGIAGAGASCIGFIGHDQAISNWGSNEITQSSSNLTTAGTDITKATNDFMSAIKDGAVAPFAEFTGDLAGFITDDQKIGNDISTVISKVDDSLLSVASAIIDEPIEVQINMDKFALKSVHLAEEFADTVGDAAWAIFSKQGQQAFLKEGNKLGKDCITAITQSFTGLVNLGKADLNIVMTSLGAIINSLTTIFIDLSREVTYVVLSTGLAIDDVFQPSMVKQNSAYAKKERNKITNILEAHRSTINQVMGVAICIAADVAIGIATGGAGEVADAGVDTAIMGAAEAGAETTGEVTAEAGAEAGGDIAAETTGETTTETTETTAQQAAEETAKTAAKDISENTEEETAEDSEESAFKTAKKAAKKIVSSKAFKLGAKGFGMAVNIVFGLFNAIGGDNADQKASIQELNQAQSLKDSWRFINENNLSIASQQHLYLQEIQEKQQAEIGNQAIALALSENITFAGINSYQTQIANYLAPQYAQLLTVNPETNLLPADIGSIWSIETPYLNLYPSQGFFTTTTGRADFPYAQEIASAPFTTTKKTKSSAAVSSLWFNQRCIAIDKEHTNGTIKNATDPLTVSVNLKCIYTLNSACYTGIQLGGNYNDYRSPNFLARLLNTTVANISTALAAVQKAIGSNRQVIPATMFNAKVIDLSQAYLAKMFVLYREKPTDPVSVGVYENEGLGWILRQQLPASLNLSGDHVYKLTATLAKDTLSISLFIDNSTTALLEKTLKVTPIKNQRSYGIICSGAAATWKQLTPTTEPLPSGAERNSSTVQSEVDREKQSKIELAHALSPTFGNITLKPLSKHSILLGQYVYGTKDTDIKKIDSAIPADFVVFAENNNGSINNIGKIPGSPLSNFSTLVMLSLITGTVYDINLNTVATMGNLWASYSKKHGPFSDKLNTYITSQQASIAKILTKIKFGSFSLNIINATAIPSGLYIYQCLQTIAIKNNKQAPIIDYLVMAEVTDNALGNFVGMSPTSNNAQGLLSLVTGNFYLKNTVGTPLKAIANYNASAEFGSYNNQFNLPAADQALIEAAQSTYAAALVASQQPAPTAAPIIKIIPINQTSASNISGIHLLLHNLDTPALKIDLLMNGKLSFEERQQSAAGISGFHLMG